MSESYHALIVDIYVFCLINVRIMLISRKMYVILPEFMRKVISIAIAAVITIALASCLGDDDDTTLYDDIAITDFYLTYGEVTKITEASDGSDSTYIDEYDDIDDYIFRIDQVNCLIYNPDSLPMTLDASRLMCTYSTKNNAYAFLENIMGDSIKVISTTDTIDFRVSRYVQCYSSSFEYYRRYKVTVNVRQEEEGQLKWAQYDDNTTLASLYAIKALRVGETMVIAGYDGATTLFLTNDAKAANNGEAWATAATTFEGDLTSNVAVSGGRLYLLDGSTLKVSDDVAETFTTVAEVSSITRLIGGTTTELHAVDNDCRIALSTDGGYTWTTDSVGSDEGDYLTIQPTNSIAYTAYPFTENDSTDYALLSINNEEGDTLVHCWRKIVQYGSDAEDNKWVSLGTDDTQHNRLHQIESLATFRYNGALFATGIEDGTPTLYISRDGGITWKATEELIFDDEMDTSLRAITAVGDGKGHAWFFCAGTGEIWRGYINNAEDEE